MAKGVNKPAGGKESAAKPHAGGKKKSQPKVRRARQPGDDATRLKLLANGWARLRLVAPTSRPER